MPLFRAFATRLDIRQPSTCVFFEADHLTQAPARLLRLLGLVWDCELARIEFWGLYDESALLHRDDPHPLPAGDIRLMVAASRSVGPLFLLPEQTLMLTGPDTLRRLLLAQAAAAVWPAYSHRLAEMGRAAADAARAPKVPLPMRRAADRCEASGAGYPLETGL